MCLNKVFISGKVSHINLSVEFISEDDVTMFKLLKYCECWRFIYITLFVEKGNVSKASACGNTVGIELLWIELGLVSYQFYARTFLREVGCQPLIPI